MKIKVNNIMVYDIFKGVLFQRGKMHRFPFEEKEAFFRETGISCVVGLSGHVDEDLAASKELAHYQYYGIPDNKISDTHVEYLKLLAKKLANLISDGHCVLVHCNAGRNRSGLLNAMVICHVTGCTGSNALEIVRKERPNALANPHFEAFLREYEAQIGG